MREQVTRYLKKEHVRQRDQNVQSPRGGALKTWEASKFDVEGQNGKGVGGEVREVMRTKSRIGVFFSVLGDTAGFTKIALATLWKTDDKAARLETTRPEGRQWEYLTLRRTSGLREPPGSLRRITDWPTSTERSSGSARSSRLTSPAWCTLEACQEASGTKASCQRAALNPGRLRHQLVACLK